MEVKTVYRVFAAVNWHEMIAWCSENLYHGGYYEPKWYRKYPFIVFEDEQEYAWFMLRWS